MSSSAEVYYEREQRRRELYENRIRSNVETFLARYESVLDDMRDQGLDEYVRGEFDHAVTLVDLTRAALGDDLEQAREFSFELGELLHGLPAYARSVKRGGAKSREAVRMEALKEELREVRGKLSEEAEKARGAAAEAFQALVTRLDQSLQRPEGGESSQAADIQRELREVHQAADEVAVDEALRKDTIHALSATMKGLGFAPDPVVWQGKWMRVRFHNLNGEQALFLVGADGGMKYSFSGYQGAACKKDRDQVRARLADAYGVKFSDRRVISENPDRIEKSAAVGFNSDSINR